MGLPPNRVIADKVTQRGVTTKAKRLFLQTESLRL